MDELSRKKAITDCISQISGKYSAYEVFSDWIRCVALSISNSLMVFHNQIWKDRERAYIDTMSRYSQEEQTKMYKMTAMLILELEENGPADVLGDIYMHTDMGSKATGQFFTPFHLSELCARIGIDPHQTQISENDIIEMNEPSCGGGGMIIAAAKVLHDAGINYQKKMRVVAQDLDWKSVYMCYVQLSLLGIHAICVQGDTLCNPFDWQKTEKSHMLFTPAYMGVLV